MKIFVAGATGVIGRRLVPELVRRGHDVVGTTRTQAKLDIVRAFGAEPALVDALDETAVKDAVAAAAPEVVVNELTAIPEVVEPRRLDRQFAATNRLRTEGTDNLVAAAGSAGARRLVAQSFEPWIYARVGGPVKVEHEAVETDPPASVRDTLAALLYLERRVTGAKDLGGTALRYGMLYGPGTSIGEGGSIVEMVRKRRFPIVGRGSAVWSLVHVDDAASATVAAIERGGAGIYNVVDDDPAEAADVLAGLADAIGAPAPRRIPSWLVQPLIGEAGLAMMTDLRGASNAKAKRELGWTLRFPSWRGGFRNGLE